MVNNVVLVGRLTKDVELRYTQDNKAVANFTLAIDRNYVKEKQTDFINVIAWNKTGEFVSKYFKKGLQVSVVGRLQTRTWDDQNGQKRYAVEVVASEVGFADSKKEDENVNNDIKANDTIDDLPF